MEQRKEGETFAEANENCKNSPHHPGSAHSDKSQQTVFPPDSTSGVRRCESGTRFDQSALGSENQSESALKNNSILFKQHNVEVNTTDAIDLETENIDPVLVKSVLSTSGLHSEELSISKLINPPEIIKPSVVPEVEGKCKDTGKEHDIKEQHEAKEQVSSREQQFTDKEQQPRSARVHHREQVTSKDHSVSKEHSSKEQSADKEPQPRSVRAHHKEQVVGKEHSSKEQTTDKEPQPRSVRAHHKEQIVGKEHFSNKNRSNKEHYSCKEGKSPREHHSFKDEVKDPAKSECKEKETVKEVHVERKNKNAHGSPHGKKDHGALSLTRHPITIIGATLPIPKGKEHDRKKKKNEKPIKQRTEKPKKHRNVHLKCTCPCKVCAGCVNDLRADSEHEAATSSQGQCCATSSMEPMPGKTPSKDNLENQSKFSYEPHLTK